jgi:hypothetical protein
MVTGLPQIKARCRSNLTEAIRVGLFALVLHTIVTAAPAAELKFQINIIDASPPSDSSCCLDVCAIGDIDGDGTSDVLVGSQSSVGAVWYHAPDWARYAVGAGSFSTDGEIADIDGDGDSDVVLSCVSRDRIEWWENLGDPTQANSWACYPIGNDFAHDVCIGDIDGDGNLDVVIFRKDLEVLWFQAPPDPHGSWTRRSISELYGEGLDLGDIDGDGDLDVVASQWWCENENGQGTSWALWMVAPDWESSCRDIVADMNGDSMKDIVLSHSEGSGKVAWFENPSWTGHVIEPDTLVGAHSLEVVDFDHDGDPDVFTGEMHTSPKKRVLAYRNNGGGLSWSRTTLATTGTHNARVGDVTGDGRIDIVGKNYDGVKEVDLWENRSLLVGIESPAPPQYDLDAVRMYPNPFSAHSTIEFDLLAAGRVRISVYDPAGRFVRALADQNFPAGPHSVLWDGTDVMGQPVPSGVYLVRASATATVRTRKLVLVR